MALTTGRIERQRKDADGNAGNEDKCNNTASTILIFIQSAFYETRGLANCADSILNSGVHAAI